MIPFLTSRKKETWGTMQAVSQGTPPSPDMVGATFVMLLEVRSSNILLIIVG